MKLSKILILMLVLVVGSGPPGFAEDLFSFDCEDVVIVDATMADVDQEVDVIEGNSISILSPIRIVNTMELAEQIKIEVLRPPGDGEVFRQNKERSWRYHLNKQHRDYIPKKPFKRLFITDRLMM